MTDGRLGETNRVSETRQRILDAAVELFGERGFSGVSVRDIAERAGVKKALVFYHHESKAILLQRALEPYYVSYRAALGEAEIEGSLGERLHHLLDANIDFIEENFATARLVQIELLLASGQDAPIQEGITALYRAIAEVTSGHLPREGALATHHLFISFSGMINTYFLQARSLQAILGDKPLGVAKLRERRAHIHWMLDAVLAGLESSLGTTSQR